MQKFDIKGINVYLLYIIFSIMLLGNIPIIGSSIVLFGLILIVSLFTLVLLIYNGINLKQEKEIRNILLFYLFWMLYSLIQSTFFINREMFLVEIMNMFIMFILLFLAVLNTSGLKKYSKGIKILLVPIIFHTYAGLIEVFTGEYIFTDNIYISGYLRNKMPVSSLYNTNNYATVLVFFIILLFYLLISSKKWQKKFFIFILLLADVFLLYMTQSRGNLLGLLTCIVIYVLLMILQSKHMTSKYIKLFFVLLMLFILICIAIILMNIGVTDFRTIEFFNNQSNFTRLNLIKNGFYFLSSSKYLGVGLGNIENLMMTFSKFPTNGIFNLHNFFIEIMVSSGIIVFTFFVKGYIQILYNSVTNFFNPLSKEMGQRSLYLVLYLCAFLFSSISPSSLFQLRWFWAITTFILLMYSYTVKEQKE
ncbi:O-antigen ligase family protein [Vagococcus silagei]|uniref:O-antigen ligase-related domain-containing protein n=1 Tax=Vagococcus silagei TaxID=2508885 RepID=A0A4S3B344_9ENTE|nr:O-antigen ligase family protein [Vagococcus silagei]THB60160.1 hypothetical protein ESZ54_11820 [Vagococcus silagei]